MKEQQTFSAAHRVTPECRLLGRLLKAVFVSFIISISTFSMAHAADESMQQIETPPDLEKGWNLISAPCSATVDSLARKALDEMKYYTWDGSDYVASDTIERGRGYLVNSKSIVNVSSLCSPTVSTPIEISLTAGWNMLGNPYHKSVATSDIFTGHENEILSIFEYRGNKYVEIGPDARMKPWRGYWVFSKTDFTITTQEECSLEIRATRTSDNASGFLNETQIEVGFEQVLYLNAFSSCSFDGLSTERIVTASVSWSGTNPAAGVLSGPVFTAGTSAAETIVSASLNSTTSNELTLVSVDPTIPESLSISPGGPIEIFSGESVSFAALAAFEGNEDSASDITELAAWDARLSDDTVGAISGGLFKAAAPGRATVTASFNGMQSNAVGMTILKAPVNCESRSIEAYVVNNESREIESFPETAFSAQPGETYSLRAFDVCYNSAGSVRRDLSQQIEWSTTNSDVAEIEDIMIKILAEGEAQIEGMLNATSVATLTIESIDLYRDCEIKIVTAEPENLSECDASLPICKGVELMVEENRPLDFAASWEYIQPEEPYLCRDRDVPEVGVAVTVSTGTVSVNLENSVLTPIGSGVLSVDFTLGDFANAVKTIRVMNARDLEVLAIESAGYDINEPSWLEPVPANNSWPTSLFFLKGTELELRVLAHYGESECETSSGCDDFVMDVTDEAEFEETVASFTCESQTLNCLQLVNVPKEDNFYREGNFQIFATYKGLTTGFVAFPYDTQKPWAKRLSPRGNIALAAGNSIPITAEADYMVGGYCYGSTGFNNDHCELETRNFIEEGEFTIVYAEGRVGNARIENNRFYAGSLPAYGAVGINLGYSTISLFVFTVEERYKYYDLQVSLGNSTRFPCAYGKCFLMRTGSTEDLVMEGKYIDEKYAEDNRYDISQLSNWKVSDTSIAEVSDGKLIARAPGFVYVSGYSGTVISDQVLVVVFDGDTDFIVTGSNSSYFHWWPFVLEVSDYSAFTEETKNYEHVSSSLSIRKDSMYGKAYKYSLRNINSEPDDVACVPERNPVYERCTTETGTYEVRNHEKIFIDGEWWILQPMMLFSLETPWFYEDGNERIAVPYELKDEYPVYGSSPHNMYMSDGTIISKNPGQYSVGVVEGDLYSNVLEFMSMGYPPEKFEIDYCDPDDINSVSVRSIQVYYPPLFDLETDCKHYPAGTPVEFKSQIRAEAGHRFMQTLTVVDDTNQLVKVLRWPVLIYGESCYAEWCIPSVTDHLYWDQTDENGLQVPPGRYYIELTPEKKTSPTYSPTIRLPIDILPVQ